MKCLCLLVRAGVEENHRHRGPTRDDQDVAMSLSHALSRERHDGIMRVPFIDAEPVVDAIRGVTITDAVQRCIKLARKYERTDLIPMMKSGYGELKDFLARCCKEEEMDGAGMPWGSEHELGTCFPIHRASGRKRIRGRRPDHRRSRRSASSSSYRDARTRGREPEKARGRERKALLPSG